MTNTQLFHLAYISTQTQKFTTDLMTDLLTQARHINHSRDITGLLLHKGDSFFQILEGPHDAVIRTFRSISRDPRHTDVETIMEGEIPHREFSEWSMGFLDLTGNLIPSELAGYSDFLVNDHSDRKNLRNLGKGERLALLFKHVGTE